MKTTRRMLLGAAAAAPFARLAAPAIAQTTEIVWWAPNWGQARAEELKRRFEAENAGLRIKLEITVADGLQNRALAAIRSASSSSCEAISAAVGADRARSRQNRSRAASMVGISPMSAVLCCSRFHSRNATIAPASSRLKTASRWRA